jgi:type IV fimbrial biogenesis protein FimT
MHSARASGFTLIELMVALAVGSVLLSFALPSFRSYIQDQRVRAGAESFYGALTLARSEAIKRNAAVTLAPRSGTDWSQGWKITASGISAPLQQQAARQDIAVSASSTSNVVFAPTGRASSGASLTFTLCDSARSANVKRRMVQIDASGYASISQGSACS